MRNTSPTAATMSVSSRRFERLKSPRTEPRTLYESWLATFTVDSTSYSHHAKNQSSDTKNRLGAVRSGSSEGNRRQRVRSRQPCKLGTNRGLYDLDDLVYLRE